MTETRTRRRLDQPRSGRRFSWDIDPEAFGRFSEGLARFMGTGTFLFWQTMLVISWITLNIVAVNYRWDPFPFILLNLALSFQAAYAAPIIMMSQNRQSEKDHLQAKNDYEVNLKAELEIMQLHEKVDGLQAELRERLDALAAAGKRA